MAASVSPARSDLVQVALVGELILGILGLMWLLVRGNLQGLSLAPHSLWLGILLSLPFLSFGFLLTYSPQFEHADLRRLREDYLIPLVRSLSVVDIVLIALASGIAEEILFRGALLGDLRRLCGDTGAVLISGGVFAYAHFIGIGARFPAAVGVYWIFGVFLGSMYVLTEDLWALIALHATHNVVTMLVARSYALRRHSAPSHGSN